MILGLGTDILEINRLRSSFERSGQTFLDRLFTEKEQEYCRKYKDPFPHLAGRFAAKEAIAKAFGTGFGSKLSWHDLEILNDTLGKPEVTLSDKTKKEFNNPQIFLSISHCTSYASATAIWTQ